jgi:biotin carboxyl carrier protein
MEERLQQGQQDHEQAGVMLPRKLRQPGRQPLIEIEETGGAVEQPAVKIPSTVSVPSPVKAAPAAPQAPAPAVTIAAAGSTDVLSAPMPGVILDIAVKPGQTVAAGDPICALEAMKMKNILRSHRDGTIASIEVNEGQRVPFGAVIVRFA